ncbi:MAG: molybdopterin converting factor subunit 1 [Bacteroidota bacterium]
MEINILAFGIAKDILGSNQLQLQLPEAATVAQLKQLLLEKYPAFEDLRALAIAVNSAYADDQLPLQQQDEVALIPPVSGG